MSKKIECTNCGKNNNPDNNFCVNCGCKLHFVESLKENTNEKLYNDLMDNIKTQVKTLENNTKNVSQKANDYTSNNKSSVVIKAREFSKKAGTMVSPEKASDVVQNMINLMLQVAQDVNKEIPPKMRKAIDLEAEVSFIAFSIGISIDLEQLE